jgi:hypothetical protein
MTEDEEKRLRLELLAVDLSLKRKQEFWETPRNIAILVILTAAIAATIAAGIGFWLGRESAAPSGPVARPVGAFFGLEMRGDEFIDIVQTAGILVIAGALVYVVLRLDRTLTMAAEKLQGALSNVMKQQSQLQQNVRRLWERIDLIESLQGAQKAAELKTMLDEIRGRLDRLEKNAGDHM